MMMIGNVDVIFLLTYSCNVELIKGGWYMYRTINVSIYTAFGVRELKSQPDYHIHDSIVIDN